MLDSRVVIVTGAGRGIGRATCRRFAAAGDQVVAAARTAVQLEETCEAVEREGGACMVVVCDLVRPDEVGGLIETAREALGRVDVLVNNAGVAVTRPIDEIDADSFARMQAVNVDAVFHACHAVWPIMREQGGGVIINVSSIAAYDPFPGFGTYGASKAWVNAFTRGLAEEGRPLNIRAFAVAPGAVDTEMMRAAIPDFPADKALDPSAVAEMIFMLAEPGCGPATGQVITVKK